MEESVTIETSEIKGKKALAFLGVMFSFPFILIQRDLYPEIARPLILVCTYFSAATWEVSRMLPAGWLNLKRTLVLAVVLSSSVGLYVRFGAL